MPRDWSLSGTTTARPARRGPACRRPAASDFDWPESPALELWALRVRLDAACRKGEQKQGWVPCRVIRRSLGAA